MSVLCMGLRYGVSSWLSAYGDSNWNPACDISIPADDIIDVADLIIFIDSWLANIDK